MSSESTSFSFERASGKLVESLKAFLGREQAAPIVIIALWACAVLPSLALHSFIYEEGTNAEIARDVLAHGHFLAPVVYGFPWHEKPSLLPWLIAAVAALTGSVDEWSARLPAMISVLLTALLVQRVTRHNASLHASLLAALFFLFSPMLLQKLTIAEPDTVITFLSFAALVLWWNGASAGPVSIARWFGCGLLLAILAMAKGPQPAGFFILGTGAYLCIERRWRDLPGWALCAMLPLAAIIAWGATVYQPGAEKTWLSYARLGLPRTALDYIYRNVSSTAQMIAELLPAVVLLPFLPRPRRNAGTGTAVPPIVLPLLLYSGVCTAILVFWPGFASRYAMPIVPAVAVLGAIAWDALEKSRYWPLRRVAGAVLGLLVVYQIVLVAVVKPVFAEKFSASRIAGETLERVVNADPAPVYCFGLDTNQLFYVHTPIKYLDQAGQESLQPPAWLLVSRASLAKFERLRPDLDIRVMIETTSGAQLVAARVDRKSGVSSQ